MRPAMYIFINKGLGMSAGKVGAQAGHAAVEAYKLSIGLIPHWPIEDQEVKESATARHWYKGGHYAKYVMEAKDEQQLFAIRDYLGSRGFQSALIVDEGHTEGTEFVATALGVEVVDKDHPHVAATFGEFKLYKDEPRYFILESTKRISKDNLDAARKLLSQGRLQEAKLIVEPAPRKPSLWKRGVDKLGAPPR